MKKILILLLLPMFGRSQNSCNSPLPLILDGVCRTFSSGTDNCNSLVCTTGQSGICSWFSFTTNSTNECIDISINSSVVFEVSIYSSCNNELTSQRVCALDGKAHWATEYSLAPLLQPNTTYKMRIWSSVSTTYVICANYLTPSNGYCALGTPLDANWIPDHNCCNLPSNEVSPPELCAFTLENTAWYSYTTANTQASIINIRNLNCDNIGSSSTNGFQIGFFTGNCGNLTNIDCESGNAANGFVQFTAPVLPIGTTVFVAIDGFGGSNCEYEIQAINAIIVSLTDRVILTPTIIRVRNPKVLDIAVYNYMGQLIYKKRAKETEIPTSDWKTGIYIIVTDDGRFVKSHKYLK